MRETCTRITLTSDNPWYVSTYDDTVQTNSTNNLVTANIFDTITNSTALVNPARTQIEPANLVEFRAKFGWIPLNVFAKTFYATTQLAKNHLRLSLRRHFKARFPQLNKNRLHETYATDT